MNSIHERVYVGDIVRMEQPNFQSRKLVTIAEGQVLKAGSVLGAVLVGAATIAAFANNAANTGTIASVATSKGAKIGDYKVVIIEPASDAGAFTVEDPDGITIGTGTVGVAFSSGGLAFTVTDGATNFVSGEGFTITVAKGSSEYKLAEIDATDGSHAGAAILLQDVDATDETIDDVLAIDNHAQVDETALIFGETVDDADKRAAVLAPLKAAYIQLLPAA